MCEYRNWEVIYAMNHQLDEMLAYMGCINPKSITQSEQSELLRRASTKDDNGYIWSIFAYCVFDFYNFDPQFGIISLLQYNQNKHQTPYIIIKKRCSYLLSIFYASIEGKHKINFIRGYELAFQYFDEYFSSVGIPNQEGKDFIFKTIHVKSRSKENAF